VDRAEGEVRADWTAEALAFLSPCPFLGEFASQPEALELEISGSSFEMVSRSIVFQQLSGKAASAIWDRMTALWTGGAAPSPEELAGADPEALRRVGLSRQKASYLIDLGQKVSDGQLDLDALPGKDDEGVIEALIQVKGIGRWSAQMHLIFGLGRPDVWPILDLGVRKGVGRFMGLAEPPTAAMTEELGARWTPYRTAAALCCWRSGDALAKARIPRSGSKPKSLDTTPSG
jgi:3-methyladenine DNA glycosylase/8-oxoguanine DNA glycosylase